MKNIHTVADEIRIHKKGKDLEKKDKNCEQDSIIKKKIIAFNE
jgi:hypothetical protein